jgi:hypothetical protein
MRNLFFVCSLTLLLLPGLTAPLPAKDKDGKPNKNHATANKHSSGRNDRPGARDDSRDNDHRQRNQNRQDGRPGDHSRNDGDHNQNGGSRDRNEADRNRNDADRDRDHDWRHDGDHRDHDWDRDRDGDRGDWKHDGRHDNGLHKGWYKHDGDHDDSWNRDHPDWTRDHRDNWWRDRDADWYRRYGERDRDARDWDAWRTAQARLNQEQQLLNRQERLLIEQRNLEQRLAEVQYLRQLSQRNSNANLAGTASQLEAFAHQLYAQRLAELNGYGTAGPLLQTTPVVNPASNTIPVTPASRFWDWWPF